MAGLAQGLPIGAVPEQGLVATVRNDVIHDGSKAGNSVLAALPAVRVDSQVVEAGLAPFMIIATGTGGRAAGIMSGITFASQGALALTSLAMRHDAATRTDAGGLAHDPLTIFILSA